MNKRYEDSKIDIGLVSQALSNANVTGKYHPLAEYRSLLAILSGGAMAKTKTTKLELLQAQNAAALGAKVFDPAAEALITANVLVTELTITLATVLAAEKIVINGLTFTAHGTVTTPALREFSISGTDTAAAIELCICINDPTYGVPGVTASNAGAVITLLSTVPGEVVISAASTDATFTVATTKAQAYVDIEDLALDAGFTHVAVKVTTTAASNVAVVLIRYKSRKAIAQKMGANFPA
jgi:hypothetical protein